MRFLSEPRKERRSVNGGFDFIHMPLRFERTLVKNVSFDPIHGFSKKFRTQQADLGPLGRNGGGSFYSYDFHRLGPLYSDGGKMRIRS